MGRPLRSKILLAISISLKVLLVVLLIFVLVPCVLYFIPSFPKWLAFLNSGPLWEYKPSDHGLNGYAGFLPNEVAMVPYWHLTPPSITTTNSTEMEELLSRPGERIIFYVHGNRHDIAHEKRMIPLKKFVNAGWHVIVFEIRGYAHNYGDSSGFAAVSDCKLVYRWLRQRTGSNIVLWWTYSMGTGIGIQSAFELQRNEGFVHLGMVVEAAYYELAFVARGELPYKLFIGWLPSFLKKPIDYHFFSYYGTDFKNYEYAPQFPFPVLHFHAEDDDNIPFENGKLLEAAISEKKGNDTYVFHPFSASRHLKHTIALKADELMDIVEDFYQKKLLPWLRIQ